MHAIETHNDCTEASGAGVELETGAVVGGFIEAGWNRGEPVAYTEDINPEVIVLRQKC